MEGNVPLLAQANLYVCRLCIHIPAVPSLLLQNRYVSSTFSSRPAWIYCIALWICLAARTVWELLHTLDARCLHVYTCTLMITSESITFSWERFTSFMSFILLKSLLSCHSLLSQNALWFWTLCIYFIVISSEHTNTPACMFVGGELSPSLLAGYAQPSPPGAGQRHCHRPRGNLWQHSLQGCL